MPFTRANFGYLYVAENNSITAEKIADKTFEFNFIFEEITELKVDFVVRSDFEIGWGAKLTIIRI